MTTRRLFVLASLALAAGSGWPRPIVARTPADPRIAVAASLKFALDDIIDAYRRDTGRTVTPVYGSSGNFRRQIEQGAPFELFMSADEGFVVQLADAGLTRDRGAVYAIGRIVLFAPHGSPIDARRGLDGLAEALAGGKVRRFAIANPILAPYGRAAEEALRARGLWEAVTPKLVVGDNISQAAQFASSGSAEGGVISLSLALAPQVGKLGAHALIPAELHAPLAQRMALLRGAGEGAEAFYAYLKGSAARALFRRYGFLTPDEDGG